MITKTQAYNAKFFRRIGYPGWKTDPDPLIFERGGDTFKDSNGLWHIPTKPQDGVFQNGISETYAILYRSDDNCRQGDK